MNRFLLFFLLLACTFQLSAQSPGLIKFQAIARDAENNPITNPMDVRLTVLKGAPNGTAVYVDEQTATPNDRGLFTVNLGAAPASGNFGDIGWATDDYFLLAEIRQAIGEPFVALGEAQPILSVPYALYGEDEDADPENELQTLRLQSDGILQISNGNAVNLGLPSRRKISIPAASLDYNSSSSIISNDGTGLVWKNNFANSASIVLPKPTDYTDGDVTFRIIFLVSTSNNGKVEFFIRPRSYNSGDTFGDAQSIVDNTVSVTPTTGFGRIYEQEITIPANRLQKDWWFISIQRNSGGSSLLTEDVNVLGTSLEYSVR